MNLITLNIDSIPLGRPLPFALRGAQGALLAQRGYVIRNRAELETLQARGVDLCVDTDESGDSHRTYLHQLHQMVGEDKALGQIAKMQINARDTVSASARERAQQGPPAWLELQMRASQLLRAPQVHDFGERFHLLHEELARHSQQQPDATLLALIMLSAQETQMYSATHAVLVAAACMVTARETLHWDEQRTLQVGRAALSMNIAMTALQDHLALQTDPLSWPQIMAIENHAAQSAQQLQHLGVADPLWLEAVRRHHERTPGPLADKTPAEQLARLIQRADVFGARIAPRASRTPMLATAAMQGSYYDETRQVDEAGAALVKTLGIYPPGALVRRHAAQVPRDMLFVMTCI